MVVYLPIEWIFEKFLILSIINGNSGNYHISKICVNFINIFIAQDNYFKSDVLRELMGKFLKQYIEVFDSDNRHGLMAAYHDQVGYGMGEIRNKKHTKMYIQTK